MKQLLILICIILSVLSSLYLAKLFYTSSDTESSIENIEITLSNGVLSINQDLMSVGDNNSYYQIHVYPSQYNIICKTQNQIICDDIILKNSDSVKKHSLSYQSTEIINGIPKFEEINILNTPEKKHILLNNLFDLLYTSNQSKVPHPDTGQLNQIESECLNGIKNDMIEGSYDYENEVQQRFEIECGSLKNFEEISYGNSHGDIVAQNNSSNDNDKIKFGIDISEIKVEYRFLTKENGKFIEKSVQEKYLPYSNKISKTMKLNF